ncbi:PLD nuclease N-terminal domain-containing protein [Allokutzneria albata]|uniref:Phospholipase_D-nuclease N-terminal n=2 Tax=Allokutzneria albata TaxID=211114 RepID=A0A1G9SQ64_ALLAB|nr:PLD nuclease N-terminal domain-containing protein [Allokutzneria albata]SDM37552.1 Phospholipase_D-nuclease N-terminal [Allokutzneria albata]
MRSQTWQDLSPGRKRTVIAAGAVQVTLALTAWVDLSRRSPERVNGPKKLWAAVIAINFVGPLAYFCFGRRRDS